MNALILLGHALLIYMSIGLVWFAALWFTRSPREIESLRGVVRRRGLWISVIGVLSVAVFLWPVVIYLSWRQR
jgi:hypothetical protein